MEISRELNSEKNQNIAGRLAGLNEKSETIEEIYNSDNAIYHNGEKHDFTEEQLLSYLSAHFEDEEEVYESLKETDFSKEEVFDVFKDGLEVRIDLQEDVISRREFIATTTTLGTGSYLVDAGLNEYLLRSADQDHFKPPSSSAYGTIIAETVLEDDPLEVYILNLTDNGEEYDKDFVESRVEEGLEELEGLEVNIRYIEAEPTFEGFMEVNGYKREEEFDHMNSNEWMDFRTDMEEYFSNLRNIIANNDLQGNVSEGNRFPIHDNQNPVDLHRNMDLYANDFITEGDTPPIARLKVVAAEFQKGDAGGRAYSDQDWYQNIALINDSNNSNSEEFVGVALHELGHKLGLPHTRYPDLKRGGILPDVMSYSKGDLNIFEHIHDSVTEDYFGKQSHYNWQRVLDYYREREDQFIEVCDHQENC